MPTGYTVAIENGCSFEEFIWSCARGMGACVTMRDEPFDKPIPEKFEPSDYHVKALERLNKDKAYIESLDAEGIANEIAKEQKEKEAYNNKCRHEAELKNTNYKKIREQVLAWNPPSNDHEGLKSFMLQQIDLCFPVYLYQQEISFLKPQEWLVNKLEKIEKDIAYHTIENAKEIERTNSRNEWLQLLRTSVPQPKQPAGE